MPHTRKTLLLDEHWDITLTQSGRMAVALGDYATAQNVANECRLFTNDACFDQQRGIPYFLLALGQKLPGSVLHKDMARQCGRCLTMARSFPRSRSPPF